MATGDFLQGTSGSVNVGALYANAFAKVKTWELTSEATVVTKPPYINEATEIDIPVALKASLNVTFDIAEGAQVGRDAVIDAHETLGTIPAQFTTDLGQVVTFANAYVPSLTISTEAAGTQSGTATLTGVAVISQDT